MMIAANWQPVKEPRGFIRIVQILFALIAFATTGGFEKKGKITVQCPSNEGDKVLVDPCHGDIVVKYPFKLQESLPWCGIKKNCSTDPQGEPLNFEVDISYGTSAEFYVTTGILSFLYASFTLAFYTFGSVLYDENPILPFFDLIATGLLTLFWFLGWIAWVTQVGNLKDYYHSLPESLCSHIGGVAKCSDDDPVRFSRLTISLISGFGSLMLWAGSSWFVYKETHFFKKEQVIHYGSDIHPTRPPI